MQVEFTTSTQRTWNVHFKLFAYTCTVNWFKCKPLGKPSKKLKTKKLTFVNLGLIPPPYFPGKVNNLFFLKLDHIWVTFGKNFFFPL